MRSSASSGSKHLRALARAGRNLGQFWRRFSRNKLATASLAVVLVFAAVAALADAFFDYGFVTSNQLDNAFLKPIAKGYKYVKNAPDKIIVSQGKHKAIISEEVFAQAQKLRAEKRIYMR